MARKKILGEETFSARIFQESLTSAFFPARLSNQFVLHLLPFALTVWEWNDTKPLVKGSLSCFLLRTFSLAEMCLGCIIGLCPTLLFSSQSPWLCPGLLALSIKVWNPLGMRLGVAMG